VLRQAAPTRRLRTTGRGLPRPAGRPAMANWPTPHLSQGSVNLRNRGVFPVFALHVVTIGWVPTKSGRGQKSCRADKWPVHKKRIRRRGARMAATCRANGMDWRAEVFATGASWPRQIL